MQSDTLKSWLTDKGCRFDKGASEHAKGHATLGIKLGDKRSMLPMVGTHQDLDEKDVTRILQELGLEDADLPTHTEGQHRKPGERHDRKLTE